LQLKRNTRHYLDVSTPPKNTPDAPDMGPYHPKNQGFAHRGGMKGVGQDGKRRGVIIAAPTPEPAAPISTVASSQADATTRFKEAVRNEQARRPSKSPAAAE